MCSIWTSWFQRIELNSLTKRNQGKPFLRSLHNPPPFLFTHSLTHQQTKIMLPWTEIEAKIRPSVERGDSITILASITSETSGLWQEDDKSSGIRITVPPLREWFFGP